MLAVVYGLMSRIYVATRLVQAPFALTVAVAFCQPALGWYLRRHPSTAAKDADRSAIVRRAAKASWIPVWATIVAIVVSGLTGYLALSRFLARQLIVTLAAFLRLANLLLWVEGFAQGLGDDGAATGHWLRRAGLDDVLGCEQLALPISLFLKFLEFCFSALIMAQWGYTWPDIRRGTGSCFSASISQIRKYL